jgi:hypothetical protein
MENGNIFHSDKSALSLKKCLLNFANSVMVFLPSEKEAVPAGKQTAKR